MGSIYRALSFYSIISTLSASAVALSLITSAATSFASEPSTGAASAVGAPAVGASLDISIQSSGGSFSFSVSTPFDLDAPIAPTATVSCVFDVPFDLPGQAETCDPASIVLNAAPFVL